MSTAHDPFEDLRAGHERMYDRPPQQLALAFSMLAYLVVVPGVKGYAEAVAEMPQENKLALMSVVRSAQQWELKTLSAHDLVCAYEYFVERLGISFDLNDLPEKIPQQEFCEDWT